MKHNTTLTEQQLNQLIERYFNGDTTVDDEALLRRELAIDRWHTDVADEARFVLGYFSMAKPQVATRRASWARRLAAAACIGVLLAAGIVMLNARRGQCVAWVGGQPIDDQEQVMNLIAGDLGNMGDASDELQQSMLNQLTITN